jgi:hypothetical protein
MMGIYADMPVSRGLGEGGQPSFWLWFLNWLTLTGVQAQKSADINKKTCCSGASEM